MEKYIFMKSLNVKQSTLGRCERALSCNMYISQLTIYNSADTIYSLTLDCETVELYQRF